MKHVVVQQEQFDIGSETEKLGSLGGGAVANFVGIVRGDDGVTAIELEHYPAMTQAALEAIAEEAAKRWVLAGVTIIHRVGRLEKGEPIVLSAAASAHRHDALSACGYIMDRLKTDAPFWKKEHLADGTARWVAERKSDHDAVERWER